MIDGRLFMCAGCHCQVLICRCCDRGHQYCGTECADKARECSQREAAKRYQKSRHGRMKHAARQQRYVANQKQKMTHHTSEPLEPCDSLKEVAKSTDQRPKYHCHFCGCVIDGPLRRDFLARCSETTQNAIDNMAQT